MDTDKRVWRPYTVCLVIWVAKKQNLEIGAALVAFQCPYVKGAFTQSVLRGVIRRRLGHLKNKKYFFQSINDHFTPRNTP